jgi:hypothetical protein
LLKGGKVFSDAVAVKTYTLHGWLFTAKVMPKFEILCLLALVESLAPLKMGRLDKVLKGAFQERMVFAKRCFGSFLGS